MVNVENIIKRQQSHLSSIHSFMDKFKKVPAGNLTAATIQSRLSTLDKLWERCSTLNEDILEAATEQQQENLAYFTEDLYSQAEEVYMTTLDHLSQLLSDQKEVNASPATANNSENDRTPQVLRLPRIDLPKFSGEYTEWANFRDLFQSLVADNEHLPKVEKFHYLKTSLTGEASQIFKHLAVTEANYRSAWDTLKQRYENTRVLVNSHLQTFYQLPHMTSESCAELKRLRDGTAEVLAALKNLQRPVDSWDDLINFHLTTKFEKHTRLAWESHIGNSTIPPTYKAMQDFLDTRIRILEAIKTVHASPSKQIDNKRQRGPQVRSHLATTSRPNCVICHGSHALTHCDQFKAMNVVQRQNKVRALRSCFNCLRQGHMPRDCTSRSTCLLCRKRHHTLLHSDTNQTTIVTNSSNDSQSAVCNDATNITVASNSTHTCSWKKEPVLLATAHVILQTHDGRSMRVRALLDQGSEATFVTESVAQLLRASRRRVNVTVSAVNEQIASVARSAVDLKVRPCNRNGPTIAFTALVLPKLTTYKPSRPIAPHTWSHISGLMLADPDPTSTEPFDILFGTDMYGLLIKGGVRKGRAHEPIAQETIFGWILSGPVSVSKQESRTIATLNTTLTDIDNSLRKFWEIEEVARDVPLTRDEEQCERHFRETHSRAPDGRYIVRLPFKPNPRPALGNSRAIAEKMLLRMENKLKRDDRLYDDYRGFMTEYSDLGHMRLVNRAADSLKDTRTFIPHQAVVRETSTTTRVRVVFNASSPTANGVSLNDLLLVGPKLQQDLALILMRWRMHQYAFTADIKQMYRQILVDPRDTSHQCILWRNEPTDTISVFELLTVTYGTSSAPYLALRVLQQLAQDEGARFPLAKDVLQHDFYVDDVLSGADTLEAACRKRDALINLLKRGQFELRKWSANRREILEGLPDEHCSKDKDRSLSEDHALKILGLTWEPATDAFKFNNLEIQSSSRVTKRDILSVIARLFDPLGWLAPMVITAKILMQELWVQGLDWDSKLPEDTRLRWHSYCANMSELSTLSVPRWTGSSDQSIGMELHGFADASRRAYAAVIYLRVLAPNLHASVKLIVAKTKVAPIKVVSIPRLELCATALLARLMAKTREHLGSPIEAMHAWTDSTIVLAWLKQHPSTWKTFVANRVSEVQTLLPQCSWRHVPTAQNPADCASRGISVEELKNHSLWWHGPPWLAQPSTNWPSFEARTSPDELEQEKRVSLHTLHAHTSSEEFNLADKFSSWPRLLRVTAYCIKFGWLLRTPKAERIAKSLSAADILLARNYWIRRVQTISFSRDILALRKHQPAETRALLKLHPFLDRDGLLRVGGRLSQSTLSYDEKHPIILPKHRVSELIIAHAHLRCLHGGTQLTLRVVRQNYWIFGARNTIKSHIHQCLPCIRERKQPPSQIMADLPKSRVLPARPFTHCGVDYAGPILLRASKGRGHKTIKGYIALFVCMVTRAAHIELVTDYSSDAFIAALRRFTSRRGLPHMIYSDNGTTFQGADKELRESFRAMMKDENLASIIASDGIQWSFIPPASPHFGGIWEAGVKSVKHHLRRIVGAHTLTYEELTTLLCQIEACLNSRPISPMSDDPDSYTPLTPGHFLIGTPLNAIPEPSFLSITENRLSRYQLIQRLSEQFWKRWSVEYLHTLQQRYRWFRERPDIKVGDLVLLRNPNLPPAKWQLGRIIECHEGRDNHTRVVTVKTSSSVLKRSIANLCVLPVRTTNSAET